MVNNLVLSFIAKRPKLVFTAEQLQITPFLPTANDSAVMHRNQTQTHRLNTFTASANSGCVLAGSLSFQDCPTILLSALQRIALSMNDSMPCGSCRCPTVNVRSVLKWRHNNKQPHHSNLCQCWTSLGVAGLHMSMPASRVAPAPVVFECFSHFVCVHSIYAEHMWCAVLFLSCVLLYFGSCMPSCCSRACCCVLVVYAAMLQSCVQLKQDSTLNRSTTARLTKAQQHTQLKHGSIHHKSTTAHKMKAQQHTRPKHDGTHDCSTMAYTTKT